MVPVAHSCFSLHLQAGEIDIQKYQGICFILISSSSMLATLRRVEQK